MESKLKFELFIKVSHRLFVSLRTSTQKASNRADGEVMLRDGIRDMKVGLLTTISPVVY